jgi:hypothetical protein
MTPQGPAQDRDDEPLTDERLAELDADARFALSNWPQADHSAQAALAGVPPLVAEVRRLRALLPEYGQHRPGCGAVSGAGPCSCGWAAVEAELRADAGATGA